jgi:hypothetical protein
MDWQQLVSLMIVAAAGGLLLAGALGRRRSIFQRGMPCGCAAVSQSAPHSSIVFRARKGERPLVFVRMK